LETTTCFAGGLLLKRTEKLYAKENIFDDRKLLSAFPLLLASCVESSQILLKKRNLYEVEGLFPPCVIEYIIKLLQAENDREMSKKLAHLSGKERLSEIRKIMHKDLHRH